MFIREINWDSTETNLPKEIDLPNEMDVDEISEYLASETGWCCNSFVVEKGHTEKWLKKEASHILDLISTRIMASIDKMEPDIKLTLEEFIEEYSDEDKKELAMTMEKIVRKGSWYKGFYTEYKNGMFIATNKIKATAKMFVKGNKPLVAISFKDQHCISAKWSDNKLYEGAPYVRYSERYRLWTSEFVCPAQEAEDILYNSIRKADKEELDTKTIRWIGEPTYFYVVEGQAFVHATSCMHRKAQVSDTIKKFLPNEDSSTNAFGLSFLFWENTLVENYCGVYADEDITEEEIRDIIGPYTESVLARELWRQYNAFNAKDKEKALEQAKKKINDLQQWVDDNSEQIIQAAEARFGDLRRAEQHMGFDCGFLYFKYKDPVYAEMFSAASTVNGSAIYRSGEFSINLPFMTQSTTIKREMAAYIKENYTEEISYRTVLD